MERSTVQSLQVAGIASAFVASGAYFASSHFFLPLIYNQPSSVSTPIFKGLYYRGIAPVAVLATISSAATGTLAYNQPSKRAVYTFAAICALAVLPWTRIFMQSTISRLIEISEMSEVMQQKVSAQEVVGLLKKWHWMNLVRSASAMTAGLAGFWALMN